MVMGKTGMVRVLCLLRFLPKGNLCGVKNKVQINRPFHSYVQVLVKTSKIIYFNTVEKNALKMVKYTKFKGDTLKRTKILLYHFTEICLGPLLASPPPQPSHITNISLYFFCSLKHEKEGECGDLPAMGIPTEPKDELFIIYSYSVTFMVSSQTLLLFLLSLSLEAQN